jgi:hypothetical protein
VLATHGFADAFARLLRERGLDASVLPTRFVGEAAPDAVAENEETESDPDASDPFP